MSNRGIASETIVMGVSESVLTHPSDLRAIVGEIRHEVRQNRSVVVVMSPLFGALRRLLAQAEASCQTPSGAALTRLLVTCGQQSAALLALALGEAGVAHAVLSPRDLRFIGQGAADDAEPAGLDTMALQQALNRAPVAVLSGIEALNERGQPVLLRGGSDLTAVFIAESIGGDVRLLKDLDGVFESDPSRPPAPPRPITSIARRWRELSWEDSVQSCRGYVASRAIDLARRRHVRVRIAAVGSRGGTLICERTELEAAETEVNVGPAVPGVLTQAA